jgi:LPS-assembly protein
MAALFLSAGLPEPKLAEPGPTISMRAERAELFQDKGIVRGEGGVVLRSGGLWLRADTLDYERATGRVSAQGNLALVDGNLVVLSDAVSLFTGTLDKLRFESATLFQKEQALQPESFQACRRASVEGQRQGESEEAEAAETRAPELAESESSESEEERAAWRQADALAACAPEDFARLGKNALLIQARDIERDGQEFHARALRLTSCACEDTETAAWSLGASSATVEPGEGALLWWPTFRIRDVPVLIFPVIYIPLSERRTGLLFPSIEFVGSGSLGVDLPFFLTLGQSYDLTFTPGFLTKPLLSISSTSASQRENPWGPRAAVEFRYAPASSTSGRIKLSGIYDRGFETPDATDRRGLRGQLVLHHRSRFRHGLGIFADVAALSDARYLSDLSDNLLASAMTYLPSRVRGFWRRDDFELTLAASWLQDLATAKSGFFPSESPLIGADSPSSYQRPALFLAQMPLRAVLGPLQLGVELFVSHLRPMAWGGALTERRLLASVRSLPSETPTDFFALTRIDLAPRLYLPLLSRGVFRAELTAGARGDFSSYTPVLADAGESWSDVWGRAFADLRLSSELSRVFGADKGASALRHVITPTVQVRASTREFGNRDPDLADVLGAIDSLVVPLDELDATNQAASPRLFQGIAAVRTRLSRRSGQELLSLTLGQGFDFTQMKWSESFGAITSRVRWASASLGVRYDPELAALSLIQGRLRLTDHRGDFVSIGYDLLRASGTSLMRQGLDDLVGALADREARGQFQQINLSAGVAFAQACSVSYGIRLDPTANSSELVLLHSAMLKLRGACDCWGIDLGVEWAPVADRWSGKLLFTLKNLGSFGN